MNITLRKGAGEYHLLLAGEPCACKRTNVVHEPVVLRDRALAAHFLSGWRASPAFPEIIGRLLRSARSEMRAASPRQLEEEAARLFVRGRLQAVRCLEQRVHGHSEEQPQAAVPPPVAAKEIKETREERWVEFRVLDEKTGKPAPNFSLNLRVPGREAGRTPAEQGTAHLDGIAAGSCDILELSHDDVWEVTELS